jgi:hypothetical protein
VTGWQVARNMFRDMTIKQRIEFGVQVVVVTILVWIAAAIGLAFETGIIQ